MKADWENCWHKKYKMQVCLVGFLKSQNNTLVNTSREQWPTEQISTEICIQQFAAKVLLFTPWSTQPSQSHLQ